jgi:CRP/FNR family transcriptional regulator, cyclic AMP receptor protein
MRPIGGLRLLEVDPDLGNDLSGESLEEARRSIVLPAAELDPGPLDITELANHGDVRGEPFGVLLADGLVIAQLQLAGRECARLMVGGDLALFGCDGSDTLAVQCGWQVEGRSRVIIIDDRILVAGARWPRLAGRLYRRAAQLVQHGFVLQAVAQLSRVEDRVLALLWMVGERHGRMHPDGICIELPITHEAIGKMVGARRPTISLALKELASEGLVTRQGDIWVLDPESAPAFREPAG